MRALVVVLLVILQYCSCLEEDFDVVVPAGPLGVDIGSNFEVGTLQCADWRQVVGFGSASVAQGIPIVNRAQKV